MSSCSLKCSQLRALKALSEPFAGLTLVLARELHWLPLAEELSEVTHLYGLLEQADSLRNESLLSLGKDGSCLRLRHEEHGVNLSLSALGMLPV